MAVTINASTSTGLVQSADTSGEIELQSNGTTALKINTNEGIQILNCLGVGNATPSTSGAGITFPATQSASSDANTLDDYEEGTFTPTLIGNSGTATYGGATVNGRYTKIGRLVYINCQLVNVTKNTLSGNLAVSGMPFVTGDANSNALARYDWGATINGYIMLIPQAPVGSTTFELQLFNNGGFAGIVTAANCGSTISIYSFTACYSV